MGVSRKASIYISEVRSGNTSAVVKSLVLFLVILFMRIVSIPAHRVAYFRVSYRCCTNYQKLK